MPLQQFQKDYILRKRGLDPSQYQVNDDNTISEIEKIQPSVSDTTFQTKVTTKPDTYGWGKTAFTTGVTQAGPEAVAAGIGFARGSRLGMKVPGPVPVKIAGGVIGGLGLGALTGGAAHKLREVIEDPFVKTALAGMDVAEQGIGPTIAQKYGQHLLKLRASQQEHPSAVTAAHLATIPLSGVNPSPSNLKRAVQYGVPWALGQRPLLAADRANVANVGISAALQPAIYAGRTAMSDKEDFSWMQFLQELGLGALFSKVNPFGRAYGFHEGLYRKELPDIAETDVRPPPIPTEEVVRTTPLTPGQVVSAAGAPMTKGYVPKAKLTESGIAKKRLVEEGPEWLQKEESKVAAEEELARMEGEGGIPQRPKRTPVTKEERVPPIIEVLRPALQAAELQRSLQKGQIAGVRTTPYGPAQETRPFPLEKDYTKRQQKAAQKALEESPEDLAARQEEARLAGEPEPKYSVEGKFGSGGEPPLGEGREAHTPFEKKMVDLYQKSPRKANAQTWYNMLKSWGARMRNARVSIDDTIVDKDGNPVAGQALLKEALDNLDEVDVRISQRGAQSPETVPHELFHVFIDFLRKSTRRGDKPLVDRAYKIASESPEFQDWVKRRGPGRDNSPNEFITTEQGAEFMRRQLNLTGETAFKTWYKDFGVHLKNRFNSKSMTLEDYRRLLQYRFQADPAFNEYFKTGKVHDFSGKPVSAAREVGEEVPPKLSEEGKFGSEKEPSVQEQLDTLGKEIQQDAQTLEAKIANKTATKEDYTAYNEKIERRSALRELLQEQRKAPAISEQETIQKRLDRLNQELTDDARLITIKEEEGTILKGDYDAFRRKTMQKHRLQRELQEETEAKVKKPKTVKLESLEEFGELTSEAEPSLSRKAYSGTVPLSEQTRKDMTLLEQIRVRNEQRIRKGLEIETKERDSILAKYGGKNPDNLTLRNPQTFKDALANIKKGATPHDALQLYIQKIQSTEHPDLVAALRKVKSIDEALRITGIKKPRGAKYSEEGKFGEEGEPRPSQKIIDELYKDVVPASELAIAESTKLANLPVDSKIPSGPLEKPSFENKELSEAYQRYREAANRYDQFSKYAEEKGIEMFPSFEDDLKKAFFRWQSLIQAEATENPAMRQEYLKEAMEKAPEYKNLPEGKFEKPASKEDLQSLKKEMESKSKKKLDPRDDSVIEKIDQAVAASFAGKLDPKDAIELKKALREQVNWTKSPDIARAINNKTLKPDAKFWRDLQLVYNRDFFPEEPSKTPFKKEIKEDVEEVIPPPKEKPAPTAKTVEELKKLPATEEKVLAKPSKIQEIGPKETVEFYGKPKEELGLQPKELSQEGKISKKSMSDIEWQSVEKTRTTAKANDLLDVIRRDYRRTQALLDDTKDPNRIYDLRNRLQDLRLQAHMLHRRFTEAKVDPSLKFSEEGKFEPAGRDEPFDSSKLRFRDSLQALTERSDAGNRFVAKMSPDTNLLRWYPDTDEVVSFTVSPDENGKFLQKTGNLLLVRVEGASLPRPQYEPASHLYFEKPGDLDRGMKYSLEGKFEPGESEEGVLKDPFTEEEYKRGEEVKSNVLREADEASDRPESEVHRQTDEEAESDIKKLEKGVGLIDITHPDVNEKNLTLGKFNVVKPELEKIRDMEHPDSGKVADAFTNFYREQRNYQGQLTNDASNKLLKFINFFNPKELLTLDNNDMQQVVKYLFDIEDHGTSSINLTSRQQEIRKVIKDSLDLAATERAKFPGLKTAVASTLPHIPSRNAVDIFINRQGSAKYNDLIKDWHDYFMNVKGMTQAESNTALEVLRRGFKRQETNLAKSFGFADKVAKTGLPRSWRETNLIDLMTRYNNRYARRLAYHKAIELDKPAYDLLTDPKHGLETAESVKIVSDEIGGISEHEEAGRNALAGLVKANMLGTLTGAKDFTSNLTLGLQHQDPLQGLVSPFYAWSKMRRHIGESFQKGVNKPNIGSIEFGDGGIENTIVLARHLRDIINTATGRNHLERWTRATAFGQGKFLGMNNIMAAHKGSISRQGVKFLDDFGPKNWRSYRAAGAFPEDVLQEIAARYVESVQGTYDYRGLPRYTQRGSLAQVLSLARWNVEKFNNFVKYNVEPLQRGNITPLLMSTLGMVVGGTAVKTLVEQVTGRKEKTPELKEIKELAKEGKPIAAPIAYKLAALSSLSGYTGVLGDLVNSGMAYSYGKTKPQLYDNPLLIGINTVAGNMLDAVEAFKDGNFDIGADVLSQVMEDLVQGYRLALPYISAEKKGDIERANKMRDLKQFRITHGYRVSPASYERPNPFINRDIREFKRLQDPEEAIKMLPKLIEDAVDESGGNFDKLKSRLAFIKQNSYQTMPSPDRQLLTFYEYYQFLTKTQGKEEANRRLSDYLKANMINKVKSSLIPSI